MASRHAKKQRQRIRALEQALATRAPLPRSQPLPWEGARGASVSKSQTSMATMPLARTTRAMVEPVYASQIPPLEPWRYPDQFGAYSRNRLWAGYGGGVSFECLRLAVQRCLLVQGIHSCCTHDILQLSAPARDAEELGWRIQHREDDNEAVNTDTAAVRARCRRVQAMFESPHAVFEPSFRGFLARCMADYLTLNRVAVELIRNRRGEIVQFRAIDAATILPTYRILQRFVGLRDIAGAGPLAYDVAARLLEQETGQPIVDSEYVCVMRGQLMGTFAPGELLIWEDMPTTDVRIIFPPSYVEKALEGIISWLYPFHYNRNYWTSGNMTEVMIGLSGELDDEGFVAFQENLRENTSGIKGAWRVPIVQLPVDGQLQVIHLKQNHRDMQFDEWMSRVESHICGIYRVTTRRIGLPGAEQQGGASLFGHNQHEMVEASKEESFRIHSAFLRERLTSLVRLIDPDLEFVWSGLDVEDREAEIKIETLEVTHYRTINELRQRHGDAPIASPYADLVLNPLVFQAEGLVQTASQRGEGSGMAGTGDASLEDSTASAERVSGGNARELDAEPLDTRV